MAPHLQVSSYIYITKKKISIFAFESFKTISCLAAQPETLATRRNKQRIVLKGQIELINQSLALQYALNTKPEL